MTNDIKYPQTYHCLWSPGSTSDDKFVPSMKPFELMDRVIVTEKLDGENCTLLSYKWHARSLNTKLHKSRQWINQFWKNIRHDIPDGIRICGENLYAWHSIFYNKLPTYFLCFSIWEDERCLSWDETVEWCKLLDIQHVPILYNGPYDEQEIKKCMTNISVFDGRQPPKELHENKNRKWENFQNVSGWQTVQEGYVVRTADSFMLCDFSQKVFKYVRKSHVQTNQFWMSAPVVSNNLEN